MNNEKITPKVFWTALIGAIVFVIVTDVFDVFERISGTTKKVEEIEKTVELKMNKTDADNYFERLETLLATQTAIWTQYMISNEKDKERILKTIETNQQDIKDLIRDYQKIRGNVVDFIDEKY